MDIELLHKLNQAKGNVVYLLDHPDSLVDFHDLLYWAGEVVRLRQEIKKLL